LTPASGIRDGKKIRIRDEHPRSFFRELQTVLGLKKLKFFDEDPESFLPWIREGKIGSGINIPDPQTEHKISDFFNIFIHLYGRFLLM
jgi:hypothetical protein